MLWDCLSPPSPCVPSPENIIYTYYHFNKNVYPLLQHIHTTALLFQHQRNPSVKTGTLQIRIKHIFLLHIISSLQKIFKRINLYCYDTSTISKYLPVFLFSQFQKLFMPKSKKNFLKFFCPKEFFVQ
jgi:hypothetical protein